MIKRIIILLFFFITVLISGACSRDSDNTGNTYTNPGNPAEIKSKITEVLVPIPSTLTGTTSGKNKSKSSASDPEFAGVFLNVRDYIKLCEQVKNGIENGLTGIFKNTAPFNNPGKKYEWDEEGSTGYMIVEKESGTEYSWKITLECTESGENNKFILRYTIVGDAIKGHIVQFFHKDSSEQKFDIDGDGSPDFPEELNAEITFDGTGTTKIFEVSVVLNQNYMLEAFTKKWSSLTDNQKLALYSQGPEKLIINVTAEGTETTVNGSAYFPVWMKWNESPFDTYTSAIKADAPLFNDERHIYTFRGKSASISGTDAARIDVAFPLENTSTDSNFWTANGFGKVLEQYYPNSYQIAKNLGANISNPAYVQNHLAWMSGNYFGRIINSAFFSSSGFIGFYDGTNFYVSNQTGNLPELGDSANISSYSSISISDLQAIPPADIVNLTITVE